MIIEANASNVKITEGMNAAIENKLSFLNKFLSDNDIVKVTQTKVKDTIKVSVVFVYNNKVVKIEEKETDFYVALDKICSRLKSQMSKLHSLKIKQQQDHERALKYIPNETDEVEPAKVVKRKHTNLEVLYEYEAIELLESSGYQSYIFKNADDNDKTSMVYIRNDGNYGIIECE